MGQVAGKPSTGTTVSNGSILYKTGATAIKFPNDDGSTLRGQDFFTIPFTNHFGNTDRFTDTLGTQIYANNVVLDWSTFNGTTILAYNKQAEPSRRVDIHLSLTPATRDGFNDWYVANYNELVNIMNIGVDPLEHFNYPPFNIVIGVQTVGRIWSSSFIVGNVYWLVGSQSKIGFTNFWTPSATILVREFSINEL